ncbi:MAG: putative Cytochrome c [Nitrospira sp.]|jgi:mono/diheme cytochrome c family protein|nr:putative Cytochrome c [Nitrospira sp.]
MKPAAWRAAHLTDSLFLILLLTCSAGGLLLAQPAEEPDHRGQAIYREHCMDCHGETGKGDGAKAPFLSPRPGNLVSAATSAKTDKELLRIIAQGKPHTAMPPWQEVLSTGDQQAVLRYVRSLIRFTRSLTPASPPR